MKKIYLDTNFLIALFIPIHTYNNKAVEIAELIKDQELYISILVINETIYSLRKYSFEKEVIVERITSFIEDSRLQILENASDQHINWKEYLNIWLLSDLKPTDANHLYFMYLEGIKSIATFDSDFIKNAEKLNIEVLS